MNSHSLMGILWAHTGAIGCTVLSKVVVMAISMQGIVWMFAVVGLLTNVISVALHGLLVFWGHLGVQ